MAERLALFGGPKAIQKPFGAYRPHGIEEQDAAIRVVKSGVLSGYVGAATPAFLGGPEVQAFEHEWSAHFGVPHAVAVNSATSGLIAAVGAVGIEPGDEVLVTPWSMSATATAIVVWGGIPVFVDIEAETFNMDPARIDALVTPRTRAIVVADIFGHSADMRSILSIARKHGLAVIADCAQSAGAMYHGRFAGTAADIGVFSLNYHKHIHTGEGGMCVTGDPQLAERLQLIRNHAEAVVAGKQVRDVANMVGFNFRLGEIEAAIGREQLRKLPVLADSRTRIGSEFTGRLSGLPGLRTPIVKRECTHVYYVYCMELDVDELGASRERIVAALHAEGLSFVCSGYVYIPDLPMYQTKTAFGRGGFPWSIGENPQRYCYGGNICPVAKELHSRTAINFGICSYEYADREIDQTVHGFEKVWGNLDALRAS